MAENNNESEPEWAVQYKHPVIRAVEEPTQDNIATLTKGQAVFALCELAGVEAPDGNPDNHNGNISRKKLREVIYAVAQLREGNEVSEEEAAAAFVDENDDESDDDESDDEETEE